MSNGVLAQEGLARTILETIGALVVVLDRQGRIVFFNKACEALTGFGFEELEGAYVWDRLLVEEEIEPVKAVFADLLAGNFPGEFSNFWLTKGGERRLIDWSNTAACDQRGSVEFVIGTGLDVTDRQRVERALGDRETRLGAVVDTIVDGVITIDEAGVSDRFSRSAERMFGYSEAEVRGKKVNLLMPSPDREAHDDYLDRYLRTREKQIIGIGREVQARRKDGTLFPVDLAVSEMVVDGHRYFTGVLRDIEDRKRTESLNARLGRIVEDSLNEVYVFDADSLKFIQVNRGARENLGYAMDELAELTPIDLKPGFTTKFVRSADRAPTAGRT